MQMQPPLWDLQICMAAQSPALLRGGGIAMFSVGDSNLRHDITSVIFFLYL